jgi:NAD(P)-dependent dehydrogenase (short-subunit alcohol dehydrogenase family)
VAVVTGGARGIGRAISERFLREGATVVLLDRGAERVAATRDELAELGEIEAIVRDVRDWDGVQAAYASVAERHGRLDVSVNNAGTTAIAPALEITEQQWRDVLDVNLTGVFACSQAAARQMAPRGGGSIITLASAAALLALPGRAPYCTSKGGVLSLTRALAIEWAEHGIRVNAIGPGWVKTAFVQAAIDDGHLSEDAVRRRTPLDRLATPEEVAEVALFLAGDGASYVTGQTIFPDGGFSSYGGW